MIEKLRVAISLALVLSPALSLAAQEQLRQAAVDRLTAKAGISAKVSFNRATGAASFVRVNPGKVSVNGATDEARAREFFQQHGDLFGITNAAKELVADGVSTDLLGIRSVKLHQTFHGIPVFGSELRVHFDASRRLSTANGTFIPDIKVATTPLLTRDATSDFALQLIGKQFPDAGGLAASDASLYVYRQGLLQGIKGRDHLVYEIEVTNGKGVRERVYVDAITGEVVNQITGIYDALDRRAFDAEGTAAPGPNYEASPFWLEGDSLPTGTTEADNMIFASGETYDFFYNAFGRDSFDGAGATMDAIFNRGNGCPNASWNGTFISFCPGLTSDDVTAHEWGHAYTQYTHNLIYQWQSGALNESYSDIWGETVDQINGRGTDAPDDVRAAAGCSTFGGSPVPTLTITGGSAGGSYSAKASVNEPALPFTIGPTDMAISEPAGACAAVTGVSGKVAIIDWTYLPDGTTNECGSASRATNAFNAGATGIIFVAPPSGLLDLTASSAIASLQVSNADGATIKASLPASATMSIAVADDNSLRWLMGEDAGGAIRDMWNPTCFGNPGKVTDSSEYVCSLQPDGGGVHSNSGIPNHEYALLVDGGTYNGQTIAPIGLIKASNIFFRAMTIYQVPASGFPEHADAMAASCDDLKNAGTNLPDPVTGLPSGEIVTAADCAQVAKAALATELRTEPTFCNFEPLLAKDPPPVCSSGMATTSDLFDWEGGVAGWTVSRRDVANPGTFDTRDWAIVSALPGARGGSAFFAPNPVNGDCGADDESGALVLQSPVLTMPAEAINLRISFDHYIASETDYDGGNLKISVDGGPFAVIPPSAYTFNAQVGALATVDGGNTNPLAGEASWHGSDGGSNVGSWGVTIGDLSGIVSAGQNYQLRYEFGSDGCNGSGLGWWVDNVQLFSCNAELPSLILRDGFEDL